MNPISRESFETLDLLSFEEALQAVFHRSGQECALCFGEFAQSYEELERVLYVVDQWIHEQGITADHRLALMIPNSPDFLWLALALLRRGIPFSPLDIRLPATTQRQQLASYAPTHLFYQKDMQERVEEIRAADALGCPASLVDFAHLRSTETLASVQIAREKPMPVVPQDKPVVYFPRLTRDETYIFAGFTLENLSRTVTLIRQVFNLHRRDAVLCHMANGHFLALGSMILPAIFSGAKLLLLDRSWGPDEVLNTVKAHSPKLMIHFRKYFWQLERSARERRDSGQTLGTIQHALVNADSPSVPFRESFEELFSSHLLTGFATPLAGGFITLELPWLSQEEGFVGKPMPGVELAILDESFDERPCGRWGELAFRSQGMSLHCLPEATSGSEKLENGMLMSQQMAMEDSQGFLSLADELFDLIKISGFKVSPLEIEEPLLALGQIADVAAVNAPRDTHPDQIRLFVVPEEGSEWTPESLKERCKSLFKLYMQPTVVDFIDAIPYDDEEFKQRKLLRARYPYAE
jgi:long-chain acyl-CoA synthetase